jgi:integrase
MPRLSLRPEPRKRFHGGRWRIYWKWNFKQYSIATNHIDAKKKTLIDADLRLISAALAMDVPEFPEAYAEVPAVQKYLLDRYGEQDKEQAPSDPDWLGSYENALYGECSRVWARHSMMHLRNLAKFSGGDIRIVTSAQAHDFLSQILAGGNSRSTRNRTLAACNRFFKWAVRTKRTRRNPFEGIPLLAEKRDNQIIYCTKDDRSELIDMIKDSGWPDWLAVPIAFYAGMRREEISRLRWPDVRFTEGLLSVVKSKTGKSRLIPLASQLEQLLLAIPESERYGYVVKMPGDTGGVQKDEVTRPDRMNNMIAHLRREKSLKLMQEWGLKKPHLYDGQPRSKNIEEWKRAKADYRKAKKAYEKEMAERADKLKTTLERIGWNPFRHTFGSLLAQAGVSLDKISAWMGNTPEVCRRHYAQFIPRDRRDGEIDKL